MVNRSSLLIFLGIGAVFCTGTISADSQILQVELEQIVKDCKVEAFKSGYAALENEFKTDQEKAQSLTSFERIAQETKKEKLADLAKVLSRGTVHSYWHLTKFFIQGSCGLATTLLAAVGFCGAVINKSYDRMFGLGFGGVCTCIAIPFFCYAARNYTKTFHYDVIIKQEIARLNEIMAFIEAAKN